MIGDVMVGKLPQDTLGPSPLEKPVAIGPSCTVSFIRSNMEHRISDIDHRRHYVKRIKTNCDFATAVATWQGPDTGLR